MLDVPFENASATPVAKTMYPSLLDFAANVACLRVSCFSVSNLQIMSDFVSVVEHVGTIPTPYASSSKSVGLHRVLLAWMKSCM